MTCTSTLIPVFIAVASSTDWTHLKCYAFPIIITNVSIFTLASSFTRCRTFFTDFIITTGWLPALISTFCPFFVYIRTFSTLAGFNTLSCCFITNSSFFANTASFTNWIIIPTRSWVTVFFLTLINAALNNLSYRYSL